METNFIVALGKDEHVTACHGIDFRLHDTSMSLCRTNVTKLECTSLCRACGGRNMSLTWFGCYFALATRNDKMNKVLENSVLVGLERGTHMTQNPQFATTKEATRSEEDAGKEGAAPSAAR